MRKIDFNQDWLYRPLGGEWTAVTLPHDAQLIEKRQADAPGGGGHAYFPGNIYEYEKTFFAEQDWADCHAELLFEGIYKDATVCLNGKQIAFHHYGYTQFTASLDEAIKYGEENTLTVTADNSQLPNSRWYTGGGIYRPVSLLLGSKSHIPFQGVKITTLDSESGSIKVDVQTTGICDAVKIEIYDTAEMTPTELLTENLLPAEHDFSAELTIPAVRLWSADAPHLYQARVTLQKDGETIDEETTFFGVRKITWDTTGLYINGKNTLLQGCCVHHDNGIIGAASYAESEWRRVKILKEQGFNAIRVSHNPASTAMLAACDYYGMFVMDETFDMWYGRKTKYDYGMYFRECWQEDVRAMIERDYNHPSVILYSIGNEISEPGKPEGVETGKTIIAFIKSLDGSRAVTGGMNLMLMDKYSKGKGQYDNVDDAPAATDASGKNSKKKGNEDAPQNASLLFNTMAAFVGSGMNKAANSKHADLVTSPILNALDIAGYNYANGRYENEGKLHPNRILVGSETFPYEIGKNWDMVKRLPYLIGDFMWTGWDYLGEAGIGAWSYTGGMPFNRPYPWVLAGSGVIDILGNPDASCGLARVVWDVADEPVIGVRPVNHPGVRVSKSVWRGTNALESWSWMGCNGNKAQIDVFSKAPVVELLLNGKSLGKKKVKGYQAQFTTRYAPGQLEVRAYDASGQLASVSRLESANGTPKIVLTKETSALPKALQADSQILYYKIELQGPNGQVECNADRKLKITVEGGELLGFGSANPCTTEQYHTGEFTTYYGRAQAIVRGNENTRIIVE